MEAKVEVRKENTHSRLSIVTKEIHTLEEVKIQSSDVDRDLRPNYISRRMTLYLRGELKGDLKSMNWTDLRI